MNLYLGIVWKDDKIINHRSLIKILLNPFLRLVGLQIVSICNGKEIIRTVLMKCSRQRLKFSFNDDFLDCIIEKRRMWV
jgi:hypothetical protein